MIKEINEKISTLLTAAFGLVAALAWNGAITKIFEVYIQPKFGKTGEIWGLVIYAVVVTIIAVVVTIWIAKVIVRATERQEKLTSMALEKVEERTKAIGKRAKEIEEKAKKIIKK